MDIMCKSTTAYQRTWLLLSHVLSGTTQCALETLPGDSAFCQRRQSSVQGNRRGTTYVAVMGVALIVGMLGLTSMQIARLETKNALATEDMACARLMAQSAVAYGLARIEASGDSWRSDFLHNVLVPNANGVKIEDCGTVRFKLWDDDGDLADDTSDTAYLYGYGQAGDAVAVERVTIMSTGPALTCLDSALTSNKDIDIENGTSSDLTRVETDQTISSNARLRIYQNSLLDGNGWAGETIGSGSPTGTALENQTPLKEMPGTDVFDYYVSNGVSIDINSLPLDSGYRKLDKLLLSPAANPYGATHSEGIYVIDCQGQNIEINRIRVVGTLVLLNVGVNSGIDDPVYMEPAVANYPTLLVQGHFSLDMAGLLGIEALSEFTAQANFNPEGTPYQGVVDNDFDDNYPSKIIGLVYISQSLDVKDDSTVEGCLVVDGCVIENERRLTVNYSDIYQQIPPPGFNSGTPNSVLVKGTGIRTSQ